MHQTARPRPRNRRRRALAATLALLPLGVALVPHAFGPRTMRQLAIVVGAAEFSPFVALGAVALGLAGVTVVWRDRRAAALAGTAAALAFVLAAYPGYAAARVARRAAARVAALPVSPAFAARGGSVAMSGVSLGDPADAPPRVGLGAPVTLGAMARGVRSPGTVVTRGVTMAAADGTPLALRAYDDTARRRAAPPRGRPAVVVVYGGAWQGGSASQAEGVSRYVAGLGYLVLAADYRHAPRHPYPAAVDDVRRALALLVDSARAWRVDTARVALWGRSSGAHLAMMAAWGRGDAAPPVAVRGVVDFYGPLDLAEGYRVLPSPDPIGVRRVLRTFVGGAPNELPARYREASPASLVRAGLPPTLLVYAGRDHVVLPRFGRQAAAALRAAGSPVVHAEFPVAEHAFDLAPVGPNGQAALYVAERFLARVLR